MRSVLLGFAIVLSLIVAGCGVPGEPLPPLLEIPAPVRDLAAEQIGAAVNLHWSPVRLTTEGTGARELDRIELYEVFLPPETALGDFATQAQLVESFRKADTDSLSARIAYTLSLTASRRGQKAYFALKAVNFRGKDDGFSNIASVDIVDLPESPINLQATLTEPAIELSWTPAERSIFGGAAPTPDGYEIYRAESNSFAPPQLLGTAPSSSYQDKNFAFGSNYVYTVRAFAKSGDSIARTPESNRVEVAVIDRFPPAAPRNLSAIGVSGAVELAWSPNGESDLAGYNVYRSDGGSLIRLNSDLVTLPLYRDTAAKSGTAYHYAVKAVDRSGNEGPASAEAAATAE